MTDQTTDKKRILIVEDERPLSQALSLKLQGAGFETTVATDGEEALNLIKTELFDALLLDLVMPILDGFQVLQQLQKLSKKPPVIFVLSNLSQHEDEVRVRALGAQKFFIKSNTSLSTLVDEVKKAVNISPEK